MVVAGAMPFFVVMCRCAEKMERRRVFPCHLFADCLAGFLGYEGRNEGGCERGGGEEDDALLR